MPTKCYYRAGKDKKGKYESAAAVVSRDKFRDDFKKKFREDENFRNVVRCPPARRSTPTKTRNISAGAPLLQGAVLPARQ